jgi:hypothetical protein
MIETECLWNRNISRKKPVLKHGLYPAFTKHGSITDRAVLEHLSLNSTSGQLAFFPGRFWVMQPKNRPLGNRSTCFVPLAAVTTRRQCCTSWKQSTDKLECTLHCYHWNIGIALHNVPSMELLLWPRGAVPVGFTLTEQSTIERVMDLWPQR